MAGRVMCMSDERRNADYAHDFKPIDSAAQAERFAALDKAAKMEAFLASAHGETPEHVELIRSEMNALKELARIQGLRFDLLQRQRTKAVAA